MIKLGLFCFSTLQIVDKRVSLSGQQGLQSVCVDGNVGECTYFNS